MYDSEYSDHDQLPARCPRSHRLPQAAARYPAAAHRQQWQISSFPNCSRRALLQLLQPLERASLASGPLKMPPFPAFTLNGPLHPCMQSFTSSPAPPAPHLYVTTRRQVQRWQEGSLQQIHENVRHMLLLSLVPRFRVKVDLGKV